MKKTPESKSGKTKIKKYRFLLSYLSTQKEAFISLFQVDSKSHQINTDIVLILSQSLSHEEILGTVTEAMEEGDLTPPVRFQKATQFNEVAA